MTTRTDKTKPPKKTRVALYARVSTKDKGQDPEMQLHELQAVAKQRGWVVVDTYVDTGWSGRKERRPELDRMLDDMKRGRFQLIAVWKLDRLGRSLQHLVKLLDGFVSLRDAGIDSTSATGRLMFQIIGAFAEYESNLISERVTAGIARRRAKGLPTGRQRVTLDVGAAETLLRRGKSLTATAKAMNANRATLKTRLLEAGKWPVAVEPGPDNKPLVEKAL